MANGKPGRPSKGPRQQVFLKLPPALKQAVAECADRSGMSMNDYVAALLARETGVPYCNQEALQLLPKAS